MAWLMQKSISVADSPMVRWTPETIDRILKATGAVEALYSHLPLDHPDHMAKGSAAVGRHIAMPDVPYQAVIEELHGPLPDAISSSIVNNRIKYAVEAIEPNVHQFIPTTLILPDGSRDTSWWAMRFCNKIDAIAFEHCADLYEYRPWIDRYPDYYWYRSNEDSRMSVAVYKDRVAGKAIWWDWRFQHDFMSEDLGQYFLDHEIRGFCIPKDELNRSNHVIEV
jgi:hypothetical protein